MTWAGAIAAIKANCELAAADVTPAITDVGIGEPDVLTQDAIGIWTVGRRQSTTGGNTLSKVNIERGVMVRVYLRGAIRAGAIDEALEQRVVDVDAALLTRLWADADCGENAIGIKVEDAEFSWEQFGTGPSAQLARTITFTVWVDLAEVATISL